MAQEWIRGELWVQGMNGGTSELNIMQALSGINGITDIKVNLLTSGVSFSYNPRKLPLQAVIGVITGLGYIVSEYPPKYGEPRRSGGMAPKNTPSLHKKLRIGGMTCTGCETRIENRVGKLAGVDKVKASFTASTVEIIYFPDRITLQNIIQTIEKLGYSVIDSHHHQKTGKPEEKQSVLRLVGCGVILAAVYLLLQNTVGFNFIPNISQNMGYGILFIVGLITSVHCVAMCGGINLSQCVSAAPAGSGRQNLAPALKYNAGRVISYTAIGGIVGAFGAFVSFSATVKGIIAVLSGLFMLIMGLNMLNVFPWLRRFNPHMPRIFARKTGSGNTKHTPFIVGLLNGLMPCGPLQAMQIYALGTGSFLAGAASMLAFSLGTVPLMFGLGALSSLLTGRFTRKMMRVSAMLVMVLGVFMLGRGFTLSGFHFPIPVTARASGTSAAHIQGGVQTVTTKLQPGSYSPITVQKGIPVKWTIKAEARDINGCNGTLTIPKYNISKALQPGDNVVEFTPTSAGNIVYTCSMGMISSNITVLPDLSGASSNPESSAAADGGSSSAPGGEAETSGIGVASVSGNEQNVTVTVDSSGYSPAVLVLQKGIPAKIKFNIRSLSACNGTVVFPQSGLQLNLSSQSETPLITPQSDFTFQCGMGMLRGYVKVVDNINKVDLNAIKNEAQNYTYAAGAGCCG